MINPQELAFIRESNRIEPDIGDRDPTEAEIRGFLRFMAQDELQLKDLIQFVATYQSKAQLRDKPGLNVIIGNYYPPPGDITIKTRLMDILEDANEARLGPSAYAKSYQLHQLYETLHPFTDCNGRSGRILWLWILGGEAPLGFLHTWYYQSLSVRRIINKN